MYYFCAEPHNGLFHPEENEDSDPSQSCLFWFGLFSAAAATQHNISFYVKRPFDLSSENWKRVETGEERRGEEDVLLTLLQPYGSLWSRAV